MRKLQVCVTSKYLASSLKKKKIEEHTITFSPQDIAANVTG